ncbi:RICIN domain-containing protein [Streptomyces griseoloalbus]|uniref:RICIN domain-containing protein n=1 Tax=Streptomyces griseoloalbus TaxID=67303 RepID=A0ABV3E5Y2_9ACTN
MSEQQQASNEPSAPKAAAAAPDAEAVAAALTGAAKPPTASAPEGTGAGRTAATEPEAGADTDAGTAPTSSTGGRNAGAGATNAGAGATGRTSGADDAEEASTGEEAQATNSAEATATRAASGDVKVGQDEKGTAGGAQGAGTDEANGAQGLSAAAAKGQNRAVAAAVDGGGATGSSRSGVGRPRKPVLAAAAVAGALLVAVPLLITANDEDEDKKAVDTASADTVLGVANDPAGVFDTQSPSPTKTEPEKKETKKETKKEETNKKASAPPAAEKPAAPAAKPSASPSQKKKAVVKKAPSNLPAVLTRVLIKNNTNRTCVDVPGFSSGQPNGPVTHATCNSNTDDNQLWNVERRYDKAGPGGTPLFQIRNVMDSMCLDLPGYQGVGGATKVTEFPCDGTTNDNQLWWLDKQSDGKFWIRNAASNNQCLDSYGPDDRTRDLIVWPCAPEGQNNHEWIFTRS